MTNKTAGPPANNKWEGQLCSHACWAAKGRCSYGTCIQAANRPMLYLFGNTGGP